MPPRRPRRRALALTLVTAFSVALAAAPAPDSVAAPGAGRAAPAKGKVRVRPDLVVGIADQKTTFFTDPRFTALGVTHARRLVPWDAMSVDFETPEVDDWLAAAKKAGIRPLISFGHSRLEGQRRVAPTPKAFVAEFRKFRARYPEVTDFSVWNEPNLCGEPLCHKPELAARYYDALSAACRSCTILASEVLDGPTMKPWVTRFMKAVGHTPRVWGLHNYLDANRGRTSGTRELLRLVKGDVWFTETGGIVKRRTKHKAGGFPETPAHAAVAVRRVFDTLVPLSPRIRRVYFYHWNSGSDTDSWDSAFFGPDGRARPSFTVLVNRLKAIAAARRAAAPRRG